MGWLYQLFFPAHTPTENELEMGRYRIIAEGAVAGVIYAIATGNFLAGYLSSLGASVSLCAAAAMIPSFGCVLQFFSPFVFERMHHRKLAIWLMCVVFRLSISSILLVPLALPDPGHARAVVLVLYTIGFFSAGLVTPGLEHMVLGIAPLRRARSVLRRQEHYRNLRFQRGNTCTWSRTGLLSGTGAGLYRLSYHRYCQPVAYCGGCRSACFGKREPGKISPPKCARRIFCAQCATLLTVHCFFHCIIGGLTGGFASPFLSVYELRLLGLSHTFITSVGVVSAVVGMAGSWLGAAGRPHCVEPRHLAYGIPEPFLHAGLVLCASFLCAFGCPCSDCRCGGLRRGRSTGKHEPAVCIEP